MSNSWWLRSPGSNSEGAAYVGKDGSVVSFGGTVNVECAIRPARWIDIANL